MYALRSSPPYHSELRNVDVIVFQLSEFGSKYWNSCYHNPVSFLHSSPHDRFATGLVVANDEVHVLGEGPVWDPIRHTVLWVDIRRGFVFEGRLADDGTVAITNRTDFSETVGAVAVSEDGSWLVAGARALKVREVGGTLDTYCTLLKPDGSRRLNDGKPDPVGRYLVGSLSLDEPSESEELFQVGISGRVRVIDNDLTLSNGLAWSCDGTLLYSIDTERKTIYRRSYDSATGATGTRETFITCTGEGYPDGMTLDSDGHLWVAMWGAGTINRYSPQGDLVSSILVPSPHTSSVAFVGDDLDTLLITTATQELTDDQRAEYPLAGKLFTIKPGVTGHPQPLWAGEQV